MDNSIFLCLLFFVELLILFFLAQEITKLCSSILLHLTHSYSITIRLLALLFLPGVIVHEGSHYLMAKLLLIPVERIEFFPQVQGQSVKLGSVTIRKTDLFRRLLVGIAPTVTGLVIVGGLFWFGVSSGITFSWKTGIFIYSIMEITTTMFSSKKDVEGSVMLLIVSIVGFVLWLWLVPSALQQLFSLLSFLKPFLEIGIKILTGLVVMDGVIYIAGKIIVSFF